MYEVKLIIIVLIAVSLSLTALVLMFKKENAASLMRKREMLKEAKKTEFVVVFSTKDGEAHQTSHFKAKLLSGKYLISASEQAYNYLNQCYSQGYFAGSDGNTYPVCNISKAWLEKIEAGNEKA